MNHAIKITGSGELAGALPVAGSGTLGYARVSSEQTDRQTLSPDAQAGMIRAYASVNGLGDVEMVYERKSAKNLKGRPELLRILAMCRAGQVKHLIVTEITRLSRDLGDALKVFEELDRCNVQLHGATRQIDRSTADGQFVSDLDVILGVRERAKLAERTTAALRAKPPVPYNPKDNAGMQWFALKKYYLGKVPPPRGYRYKMKIVDGRARAVGVEENPKEMAMIRRCFELRWQGKSFPEIAAILCSERYRTRRGGLYGWQAVEKIIHNSLYWTAVHPDHVPKEQANAEPNADQVAAAGG